MPDSGSDEFDDYDLSEFTADELAAMDAAVARGCSGPAAPAATRASESPYDRFRSWKKSFAVTDLVNPLWCEVQYEYALYGKRYKPLPERPASFTSKSGKEIHVLREISRANDRTLKRGKSVHQALEDELHPVKVTVQPVSNEERFGLRLVQLIDGFNELVSNGITRELPVFVITHAQVVIGTIDEVLCSTPGAQVSSFLSKKKQRRTSLPAQQEQPDTNSPSGHDQTHEALISEPGDSYELRIIDYKTRRAPNIPLDQDSLSPRLQLMMYHRMLSSVLRPEAFDFALLWDRLNLNPRKSFSSKFLNGISWEKRQTGPADSNVHLDRLVLEWKSTVQRQSPTFTGVSQHMQLVYRRSVDAGKRRGKDRPQMTHVVDRDDPLETLVLQEELDLARAIEASLGEMGYQEASQVANQVAHSVKQVGPQSIGQASAVWQDLISPSDSDQADPALAWAIQQSLLSCARRACDQIPASETETKLDLDDDEVKSDEQEQKQMGVEVSSIIGVKKVEMNDEELDTHMADVLQWWLGLRPARGVGVALTNRCFTCEYQNSCEWREQKAKEAVAQVAMKRAGSETV